MTLTRKAEVRAKAEGRVKEEGARLGIRIRIRIRTTIISQEVLPEPRMEPDATPVPQEEQGIAMSGVRAVLTKSPDRRLRESRAHRKVRAIPRLRLLLLQLALSLKRLKDSEV